MITYLSLCLIVLFACNTLLLVFYYKLATRYKLLHEQFLNVESSFEKEVQQEVAKVHAQWKSYVEQIARPGQA